MPVVDVVEWQVLLPTSMYIVLLRTTMVPTIIVRSAYVVVCVPARPQLPLRLRLQVVQVQVVPTIISLCVPARPPAVAVAPHNKQAIVAQ